MRTIEKEQVMTEEKNWLTCREAASILNYSQRHIVNLIKNGKLSAQKDEDGKYYIQKSEFFRVYPNTMKQEKVGTVEKLLGNESVKFLEEKIRHLQEMVDEKKRQNEFLTQQLNNFTEEKSKMLEAINSHTRLLEFKETTVKSNSTKPEHKSLNWIWPFKKR